MLVFGHPSWSQDTTNSAHIDYVKRVLATVEDESRQTGNLNPDSLASLPIGIVKVIGDKRYIIAIDSAKFTPNGAYFSAFMGVELPNANAPIYFGASNIRFNPKGVIGGALAKLKLLSTQRVNIGPQTQLEIPGDGSNYISWDCNGFQSLQLHGRVHFSRDMLIVPNNANDTVTAEFTAFVTNFNNIMASASIEPFAVRGLNDMIFSVSNASIDFSDNNNPSGMTFPANYVLDPGMAPNQWRGFYLKNATVTLPASFNKNSTIPTQLAINNMLLDESGITASLQASNVLPLSQGDARGWPISVEQFNLELVQNSLTSGSISGILEAKQLSDRQFSYTAAISKGEDENLNALFSLSLGQNETVNMAALNASLTLDQSSYVQVHKLGNKWSPRLVLNGEMSSNSPGKFNIEGITFQDLTFVPQDPYITNGVFALVSNTNSENDIAGFQVQFQNFQLGLLQNTLALDVDAMMNFGADNYSFGVSSGIQVQAVNNGNNWVLDQTRIKDVSFQIQTEPFKLYGTVAFNNNHPVYGKGFQGSLGLSVANIIDTILVAGVFGNVNDYRYWSVDFAAPVNINLGPNFKIKYLAGGMSQRMSPQSSNNQLISKVNSGVTSGQGDVFVPDQSVGLSFRAGAGVDHLKEDVFNSDVAFSIAFNANGGLSDISLIGNAYMLAKRNERSSATNCVKGSVDILYDNNAKILDADLNVNVTYNNIINGNAWSKIYLSPQEWYIHVGRPANRCYVNVSNLGYVDAYIMAGQNLDPIPAPPPQVANLFNSANLSAQRDEGAIASGDGFACGMAFNTGISKTAMITDNHGFSIYANVGAGFDITMYKYPSGAYCSQSGQQNFGMNKKYLNGQIYAYAGLDVNIFKEDGWNVDVLDANIAMLLQGQLPNPVFVRGSAYVSATVFGIGFDFEGDFELGNQCTVVN